MSRHDRRWTGIPEHTVERGSDAASDHGDQPRADDLQSRRYLPKIVRDRHPSRWRDAPVDAGVAAGV